MKRISTPIETSELCSYNCGHRARFVNGSKNLMCCESHNKCPANRKKNSEGVKYCGRDYANTYKNLPQEIKDKMNWAKGFTKETHTSLKSASLKLKWKPSSFAGHKHTPATRKKLSEIRSEYLKNVDNRKNLGRHKKSWMEITFETYLKDNGITGWETEKHFWSENLRKNFFPDFIFESKKLIIELDGTQHRKSIDHDKIRDQWFKDQGYSVIRIDVEDFKNRWFSGRGFLDLLGR
jgi:very-short-patch-repair endonuclease